MPRYRHTILQIGLLVLLLTASAFASDAELDRARSSYEKSLEKLQKDHSNNLRTWPARYVKALTVMQQKMQEAGNLDGWQMANKEIERFKSERTLNELDFNGEAPDVEKIQRNFMEARNGYEASHAKLVLNLRDRYVDHLSELQKRRTRAGKIEDALRVKEEVDRINVSEAVSAAEFAMADEAARSESERPREDQRPEKPEEPEEAEAPRSQSGIIIHPAGKIPPKKKNEALKRKSLTRTESSPLKSKVAVTYWEQSMAGSINNSKRDEHRVRLGVRGSGMNVGDSNKGLRATVQYYLKPDKRDPQMFNAHSANLPALKTAMLHVDFPAVDTTRRRSRRGSSSYYRRAWGKYYGCVVTIKDRTGRMLYQGCSVPQLKSFARVDQ